MGTIATIDEIRNLEAQLEEKRKVMAAALKAERVRRGLSLRQAARSLRIAHTGLDLIERGDSWRTSTIARIVKFYARQNGTGGKTATSV